MRDRCAGAPCDATQPERTETRSECLHPAISSVIPKSAYRARIPALLTNTSDSTPTTWRRVSKRPHGYDQCSRHPSRSKASAAGGNHLGRSPSGLRVRPFIPNSGAEATKPNSYRTARDSARLRVTGRLTVPRSRNSLINQLSCFAPLLPNRRIALMPAT